MIKNYFKIALRNFWNNKVLSLINILGLSIGISAALVIFLIVAYEFSFDRFQKDSDRIYRVVLDVKYNGTEGHSAGVPSPLSSAIQNEVTGIDATVPVMQFQGDATAKVSIPGNSENPVIYKKQTDIVFTNKEYLQLLSYQWVANSQQISLEDPFTVVLTESRAQLYFPGIAATNIIGKQLTYNDINVTVSGIVKDLNEHTVFTALEFISFPTISKTNLQDQFMMDVWNDWMIYSQLYIKISEGNTPEKAEMQLKAILNKYDKEANNADRSMAYHLQPLNDLHFNNKYQGGGNRIVHKPTLYGLLSIAAFLLLLGCINFINLTTAQASQRAKEIGVRKTMGSSKKQLVLQFLSETFLITSIATIVSVALTPILLKMFEDFIPSGLHFDLINQPSLILFLLLLTISISFLSGIYPAFILSNFKPVLVLKNQISAGSVQTRNAWIRKTLTVSQFVIAQFFVITTLMISKQINFSLQADMGFNKEAIINFNQPRDSITTHGKLLLNEIKSLSGVANASTGFLAPADKGMSFTNLSFIDGKEEITPNVNVQIRWGDPEYIDVYKIKILAGRNVERSDTIKEFLINESYAHELGFQHPEEALNKFLKWNGKNMPIVGIMKDFHFQSMRASIGPVVFGGSNGQTFHIQLKPNNADGTLWRNTIAEIQKIYKRMYPEEDFNYKFLDDTIANFYESEQHTANLLRWSTAFAIIISCLGLLGLVIYTTNLRGKEIGIRKVLGASVTQIVSILSKDFIQLVLIAFVIAAPIAWWVSYKWLEDFAYRTSLSWWIFLLSGFVMMFFALMTLSMQTIRAARANPVDSLRDE